MLYKEFKLSLHPTSLIFLALVTMMLIPNYPYYVNFFYTCLGIFFMCMTGRENNDIFYSMMLPVKKSGIVSARFITAVALELAQITLSIPFALLRGSYTKNGAYMPNEAGMDPNFALYGISFFILGLFNFVFFTNYYKDVNKVGMSFMKASTVMFLMIIIAEGCAIAAPPVKKYIDNLNADCIPYRLIILGAGIILYAALTYIAYRKSVKSFELLDL